MIDPHASGPHQPVWRTTYNIHTEDEKVLERKYDTEGGTLAEHILSFFKEIPPKMTQEYRVLRHGMVWTRNRQLLDV